MSTEKTLDKFYKNADEIITRMEHNDAIKLIRLAADLCGDARREGYNRGKEHANEINRIKNM